MEAEALHYAIRNASGEKRDINPTSGKYALMVETWKRLPLPVANVIGPWISRGLG